MCDRKRVKPQKETSRQPHEQRTHTNTRLR